MDDDIFALCSQCSQQLTLVGSFSVCPTHGIVTPREQPHTPPRVAEDVSDALSRATPDLPSPLALPLHDYAREKNPFVKLHRFVDAVEMLTRFTTLIILSDLRRQSRGFPDNLRKAMSEKIERPTFGAWRDLLALACQCLPKQDGEDKCFVTELPHYVKARLVPALGVGEGDVNSAVIPLRNLLAHGGHLGTAEAGELLNQHKQRMEELFGALSFLNRYALLARAADGRLLKLHGPPHEGRTYSPHESAPPPPLLEEGRVWLVSESATEWNGLDLFPLHIFSNIFRWREGKLEEVGEPAPQVYFRLSPKGYLEFTPVSNNVPFAQQAGAVLEGFHEIFRLREWQRSFTSEKQPEAERFASLVAELTEVFVGRDDPRDFSKNHVQQAKDSIKRHDRGVLWIAGRPGVGKSALMARLVKDYRNARRHYLLIPYFFRAGHAGLSTDQFVKTALTLLHEAMSLPPAIGANAEERRRQFIEAVQSYGESSAKKVVFLVDGLDEIFRLDPKFLSLIFSTGLPNVVWLCAGRSEPPELEAALREGRAVWVFPEGLPVMDKQAIRAMLTARLGKLKYQLFARDEAGGEAVNNRFVEVLVRKSEGLPLYVHMVVEDLREGRWTLSDEDALPDGLQTYFEQVLKRLQVSDVGAVLGPLFCLLLWAKEPIPEDALRLLLSKHYLSKLPQWEELFGRALSSGNLMLREARAPGGGTGWTFYHDSFRQHLLRSDTVKELREWALSEWLETCSRWGGVADGSLLRYILRQYAEHLREVKRWEALFALARDDAFRRAQASTLTDDPDLPLLTIQTALRGASQADEAGMQTAGVMAELVLTHVRRLKEVKQETALDALRAGRLERACELADLYEVERSTLWHLLLAWELEDEGRTEEARGVLARLQGKNLPALTEWRGKCAASLLYPALRVDETAFDELQRVLLDDYGRRRLCDSLLADGRASDALKLAGGISDKRIRSEVLPKLAEALAKGGDINAARKLLDESAAEARLTPQGYERAHALKEIIRAQAGVKLYADALESTDGLDDFERDLALESIAEAQLRAKDYDQVSKVVRKISTDYRRAQVLVKLAEAQADSGEIDAATKTLLAVADKSDAARAERKIAVALASDRRFDKAFEVAKEIGAMGERAVALAALAEAQVGAGAKSQARLSFANSLHAARQTEDPHERAEVLLEVARTLARVKERKLAKTAFAAAVKALRGGHAGFGVGSEAALYGTDAWQQVAQAMIEAGEYEAALSLVRKEDAPVFYAWVLKDIAAAQLKSGQREPALDNLREAVETSKMSAYESESDDLKEEVARLLATAGEGHAAVETAKLISNEFSVPSALAAVVEAQLKARVGEQVRETIAEAIRAARLADNVWRHAEALQEIATVQTIYDDPKAARSTFSELIRTEWIVTDKEKEAAALAAIAKAQATAGLKEAGRATFASAVETARGIEDEERREWTLAKVAAEQGGAGDGKGAIALVREFADLWRRTLSLLEVATAQIKSGATEATKTTLAAAFEAAANIESSMTRSEALERVAALQAETGDIEAAILTAQQIGDASYLVKAMLKLGRAVARTGDKDSTVQIFDLAAQVSSNTPTSGAWGREVGPHENVAAQKAEALASIAKDLVLAGKAEEAKVIFEEAGETTRHSASAEARATGLSSIAAAQAQAGLKEEAGMTFSIALKFAQRKGEQPQKTDALLHIASKQAGAGFFAEAMETAASIEHDYFKTLAYQSIASSLAAAGQFAAALEILPKIDSEHWRAVALERIAQAQARARLGRDAVQTARLILTDRHERLGDVAAAVAASGDKERFKDLLIPCAYHLDTAYSICSLLAGLYVEQAAAIASAVKS